MLPHLCGTWVAATGESHAKWDYLDTQRPQPWFPNLILSWLCRPKVSMPVTASALQDFPKDEQFWGRPGGYCILHLSYLCGLSGTCTVTRQTLRSFSDRSGATMPDVNLLLTHTYLLTATCTHDHTSIFPVSQHDYAGVLVKSLYGIYIL